MGRLQAFNQPVTVFRQAKAITKLSHTDRSTCS